MPALTPEILQAIVPDWCDWTVFIETGTYHGDTILAMEPQFDRLYTIELSDALWRQAVERYSGGKIHFHQGDSATKLAELLPSQEKPAIFFLDGHWSCGDTAQGTVDVPLLEELKQICESFTPPAVIIIDDLRLFGRGPESGEPVNWTNISTEEVNRVTAHRHGSVEVRPDHDKIVVRLTGHPPASCSPATITPDT